MQAERNISEQYRSVIHALVPFASRGQLAVGLNKLRSRIAKADLEEIRYEVNRLICPCTEGADNQTFARGTSSLLTFNGVTLNLDNVGRRILQEELSRYNQSYTAGVYEALSCEKRYQQQVNKESRERIREAFSVECIKGFTQLSDYEARVVPDFNLYCQEIDNGTPLSLEYLSADTLVLESKNDLHASGIRSFNLTFPPLSGVTKSAEHVSYHLVDSRPKNDRHLGLFKPIENVQWQRKLEHFLRLNKDSLPVVAEQERSRSRQQFWKDALLHNMPYSAILCQQNDKQLRPVVILETHSGEEDTPPFPSLCKKTFNRLATEFKRNRETYQFSYTTENKGKKVKMNGFLHELLLNNEFAPFLADALASGTLQVLKISLASLNTHLNASPPEIIPLQLAFSKNGFDPQKCKFMLYSVDVTHELNNFQVTTGGKQLGFTRQLKETNDTYNVIKCIAPHKDRRSQPRYALTNKISLRLSWLKRTDAEVVNISEKGLCLKLAKVWRRDKTHVKVSLPHFRVRNLFYEVVEYSPDTGLLNLRLNTQKVPQKSSRLKHIIELNQDALVAVSEQLRHQHLFDFVWKHVCQTVPGVHIFAGKGKQANEQLLMSLVDDNKQSTLPVVIDETRLPTHCWLSNEDDLGIQSALLNKFLLEPISFERRAFFINGQKGKFTNVSAQSFECDDTRQKLLQTVEKGLGQLIVHSLICRPYQSIPYQWFRRFDHLQKIDSKAMTDLRVTEKKCSRILSIITVTKLHRRLLEIGEFQVLSGNIDYAQTAKTELLHKSGLAGAPF